VLENVSVENNLNIQTLYTGQFFGSADKCLPLIENINRGGKKVTTCLLRLCKIDFALPQLRILSPFYHPG
jgi:hypothetical protein